MPRMRGADPSVPTTLDTMTAGIGDPTRHSDQGGWCPPQPSPHGGTVPAGRPRHHLLAARRAAGRRFGGVVDRDGHRTRRERGQLGPGARRRLSRTRASCNGTVPTTPSPRRTSRQPARRSTSRSRPRPTACTGPRRTRTLSPNSRAGPKRATRGPRASPTTRRPTISSCTTRRHRRPRGTSASGSPPPRRQVRWARTPIPPPRPAVCQNGIDVGNTVDNGNYGGSIDPDIFTDPSRALLALLEERRQPHRTRPDDVDLVGPVGVVPAPGGRSHPEPPPRRRSAVAGRRHRGPGHVLHGRAPSTSSIRPACTERPPTPSAGPRAAGPRVPVPMRRRPTPCSRRRRACPVPAVPTSTSCPPGNRWQAFAAWQGTTIGYLSCGIRPMYLADLTFDTGVSPPTPSLTPDPGGRHLPRRQPGLPGAAPAPAWILAGRLRRRRLHLRGRRLLRLDRLHEAQQARRGLGPHPRPPGLLAGGERRRRVRLRRRGLLRLDRVHRA